LRNINLGNNRIGDAGAEALASAPGLPALAVLDLANAEESFSNHNHLSRKQRRRLRERFGSRVRLPAPRSGGRLPS
jgi:hypothetical protein